MKNKKSANFLSILIECIALWKKITLAFLILLLVSNTSFAAIKTWAIAGGGFWTTPANWGGAIPQPGDDVVINQTVAGNITAVPSLTLNSISIGGTQNVTLIGAAGVTITINNTNATPALSVALGRTLTFGGGANVVNLTLQTVTTPTVVTGVLANSANNTITINASQTLNINAGGTFTANVGTINVNGSISNAGTVTGAAGNLSFTANSTYNHNQNGGTIPIATWNATSSCIINGTTNTAPVGLNQSFGNLNFNCTGLTAAVTMATGAATAVTGNLIITGTSAVNTCSVNPAGNNLTVSGTTTVNANGLLVDNNDVGTNTFTGAVTININGTLSTANNSPYNFNGGLTNSGAITLGGTGAIAFASANGITNSGTIAAGAVSFTANQNISGSGTITFTGAVSIANNVTVTSSTTISIAGVLNGGNASSTWINSANSILNYSNAVNPMALGVLNATANPNTVNYNLAAGGQTVAGTTYYNLTLGNTSGTQTAGGAISTTILNNNTAVADIFNMVTFALSGATTINNTGTIRTQNISATPLPTGLNWGGTVNYNAANGSQTVMAGTYNNLIMSNTSGTQTTSGAIIVSAAYTSAVGGILSTSYNINFNGTTACGGSINASANTIAYAITALNIYPGTYNNLTLGGAAYALCAGTTTVNGTLTINGTTLNVAANTIIANATVTPTGTNTINISTGTFTANNNLLLSTANDVITFTGAGTLNVTGNFSCKTLTVNAATINISGNYTGNTLTGNTGNINIGGVFAPTTYTINTSTVNFNGIAPQSIPVLTGYYNLKISNGQVNPLLGSVSINATGILTLTSGIIELGNYNLTINNTATNAIQGSFSNSNMIATDGTGYLIRASGSVLPIISPTGSINSGNFYSPFTITSVSNLATIYNIRAVSTYLGANFIDKYFDIYTNVARTITATFQYDPAEINGNPANYSIWFKPTVGNWQTPPPSGTSSYGVNTFTITGTTSFTTTSTYWTAGLSSTYYSYQSGSWNTPSTWTSDPGGTTQVGATVPGTNDIVVILSGRTVTLPANIAASGLDVTINNGGFLDLSTFQFTSGLLALRGQGTLKSSLNFPNPVATNTFINAGGGTTEYNANINLPAQATYNNLTINTGGIVVQLNNVLTLNGNLYVKQGTYQINDNTANRRQLIINGNVTVDNGASITVGTGVTNTITDPTTATIGGVAPFINYYDLHSHRVVINGDFTNNGTVRFTNMPYPVYNSFPSLAVGPTTGFASVYFQGASNNTLTCNGTTDFYNLIIDKGLIDQTYKLTIYSSAYSNFRLFGANNAAGDNPQAANSNLRKALWIRTGTLDLTGLTVIPSLTEGNTAAPTTSDFFIPANAAMVIDGTDVIVLSTADDYNEVNIAYGLAGGSNATYGINTTGGHSALSILGKLQVNNGYLSTRESAGLTYWNFAPGGQFIMNGGTVDTKQIDDAAGSNNGLLTYIQTGGTVIIRGRFQHNLQYSAVSDLVNTNLNTTRLANGINAADGSFNINSNAASGFSMSGGNMQIYDVCNNVASNAFSVTCPISNISVTGGNVQIIPTTGTGGDANYLINSLAPFWNLSINQVSSASIVQLNINPLTVLQNLSLQTTTQPGTFDANGLNVTVGGNFSIASAATYKSTGTTTFNGSANQTFTINGTINNGIALGLSNLAINKSSGTLNIAGSSLTVQGTFDLTNGILDDGGNTIYVAGNMTNSGTHISTPGTGKIQLNGIAAQTIGGNGNGVFQNLELNNNTAANPAPVSLIAKITVNGTLNLLSNKIFNLANDPTIASYNLTIGPSGSISATSFSNSCYIHSNGKLGDGGITKIFSSTTAFTFPVGAYSTKRPATYAYTPAIIGFGTAPSVYGSITVIPVGIVHPNANPNNLSLTYYWHVKSSGFTLGPGTVNQSYAYSITDVNSVETNYVPARFNYITFTWSNGTTASVNTIAHSFGPAWLTGTNFIDGDYTAGTGSPANPFVAQKIFYSYHCPAPAGGLWDNAAIWSLTSHAVYSNPTNLVPGANDIVLIGNNDSVYLNRPAAPNTYTTMNPDPRSCASLQIAAGSALDIGWNPACNFSVVSSSSAINGSGNGNFRLCTGYNSPVAYTFPSGDFSDYNANQGTTEFYSTNASAGGTYYLPQGVTSYGNLILSPVGGSNVIFANNNLTINGNLITRGQNADSWFCPTWTGAYLSNPTVTVAKTITINGNLLIQGGALIWYGNGALAQNFVIYGNVIVNPWGAIMNSQWGNPGTNQSMSIGGSLINNTNNAMGNGATQTTSTVDFNSSGAIPVTFFGSNNALITNTAGTPGTTFSTVTINKGTSQATTLTCNIGGTLTTLADNWLTLQNGTFIFARTNPATDFTVSTNTPLTIPSSAGLNINYSNTGNKNILIANNTLNTNDLYLSGKLTIVNGNVYIGPVNAPANNNDIEFSSGGTSAIEVDGGNLIVNGQIRRNPLNAAGILSYTQTGGNVTINGNAAIATNAKLEVLNNGSQFNMSGGTLTIIRGGGTTFGDLYLRPQTSSVTGGTIVFGPGAAIGANQNYQLDANIPLNNITITGFNAANMATVQLMVSPLVVNGNFTLSNVNSIFNAVNGSNNINVTFNGNLINNGGVASYLYGTNLTTFSAKAAAPYFGAQSITGAINFYDVLVNPVTSLTMGSNTTINRNLTISSGTLLCGATKVTLLGNLINNSSYTTQSNLANQGISLNGTTAQQISGTGSFGRLEINNAAGVKLNNAITLQENLLITQGIFDINQYLLSLGQSSTILGIFGPTNMIISDGVYSNVGIKKNFSAGVQPLFIFPIGTPGKYTPANLTITANTNAGYIRINNINSKHPTVTDPNNVLNYYWEVESYGILGLSGNLVFNYSQGDVLGPNENTWVGAELVAPNWNFFPPGTGSVNPIANTITINYNNTSSINGEYTAGLVGAFPAIVPTYTSNSDGNWDNINIWTPTSPVGGPNGFNVIINNNVTADVNYCTTYQTKINGDLIIGASTYGHNFGTVSGNGTLTLQSATFPAGRFSSFLDCTTGGTLEYGGIGANYTLVADLYSSVHNLLFSGTGNRILPNNDLVICNQLKINGPTVDNSVYNRKLTIKGTMERYNTGVFKSGGGSSATVTFAGTGAQSLGGATGDFNGTNGLNNFEINNTSGLNLNGSIDVNNNLLLTSGIITTSSTNKLTINNSIITCVTPIGGSSTSFVNGPLIKKINQSDNFIFPVGQGTTLGHQFKLSSVQTGTKFWTVQYNSPNTTSANMTGNLTAVNTQEYWTVKALSGNQAIVNINWDPSSDITPLMTQNGLSDMRVADYNTTTNNWEEISSTASGNNNNGTVSTTSRVTIPAAGSYDFTIATINTTKPKARLNPSGPVCGTTPAGGIPISFSTPNPALPYTINYTIAGAAQSPISVTSLPYTLSTPSIGTYQLTGFSYSGGTGVVDNGTVVVYANPTVANAGSSQSICGGTYVQLAGNQPGVGTGLWTITGGTGGSFSGAFSPSDPTKYNTYFYGINGNSYTLTWTITNGCSSSSNTTVAFPYLPVQPSSFTVSSATVCQGQSGVVYTVPNDPLETSYTWSYSGSATLNSTNTNSITIDFGPAATGGTLSVYATNGCGNSTSSTMTITVNPIPTAAAGSDINTCTGMAAIAMTGATSGGTNSGNSWTGGGGSGSWTQNANPAFATFTPSAASGSFTATLTVTGSGSCAGTNPTSTRVLAWATNTSISSDPSNSTIFASQNTSFTVVPGGTGPFTYAWEVSTNSGGSWNSVSGGVYSGANTATLSITGALLSMNSYYYHCIVTGTCGNATSNYGILTVNPTATATLSGTTSICVGQNATLTVTLTGTANWSITYTDGVTPHTINNIAASPYTFTVSPSSTTTYTLSAVSDSNGAGTISGGGVVITVTPVPATGPLYRKPNQ